MLQCGAAVGGIVHIGGRMHAAIRNHKLGTVVGAAEGHAILVGMVHLYRRPANVRATRSGTSFFCDRIAPNILSGAVVNVEMIRVPVPRSVGCDPGCAPTAPTSRRANLLPGNGATCVIIALIDGDDSRRVAAAEGSRRYGRYKNH